MAAVERLFWSSCIFIFYDRVINLSVPHPTFYQLITLFNASLNGTNQLNKSIVAHPLNKLCLLHMNAKMKLISYKENQTLQGVASLHRNVDKCIILIIKFVFQISRIIFDWFKMRDILVRWTLTVLFLNALRRDMIRYLLLP